MKIYNKMIDYREKKTHFYLKDRKNSPRTDWALGSQSLASHIIRVPFSSNDKNIGMGYGVDHLPKL